MKSIGLSLILAPLVFAFTACGEVPANQSLSAAQNLTLWDEGTDEPLYAAEEHRPKPASGNVSAPFDIGAVMQQVHFAFREKGDSFEGGDSTYAVRVSKNGSFSIKPFHYPNGKRDRAAFERRDTREQEAFERSHPREREKIVEGRTIEFKTLGFSNPRITTNNRAELELQYTEAIETLKNTKDGVEQSWRFAKKPAVTGGLEISVSVSGLSFVGETKNGLHFADNTKLGVRYSNATWIDAAGKKTEIKSIWEKGKIKISVPKEIVENSTYPAVLDPTIGPEFDVDKPVAGFPEEGSFSPSIAFDGNNYLVVWSKYHDSNTIEIFGTRISKDGKIIDPQGIAVRKAQIDERVLCYNSTVHFDGTNYFVVWANKYYIEAAIIDKDGNVTNIDYWINTYPERTDPQISFDGTNYIILWNTSWEIKGRIINTNDQGIGSEIVIPHSSGHSITSVVFDGTNYMVIYYSDSTIDRKIYGTRISKSGELIDKNSIVIVENNNYKWGLDISFDGTNYMVVWEENGKVLGKRFAKDGSIIDIDPFLISTSGLYPKILFDGVKYFVAWTDNRNDSLYLSDIYGARVTKEGALLDQTGIMISHALKKESTPAIAFDGENYFVVWYDERNISSPSGYIPEGSIYGARISKDGIVFDNDGIVVSSYPNNKDNPSTVFDGTNYMIVWTDNRNGRDYDVYGVRVNRKGEILDEGGIVISNAPKNQTMPQLTFDGENYMIVWQDERNNTNAIYGARVTKEGVLIDRNGLELTSGYSISPKIAFDGTNYFLVWIKTNEYNQPLNIYGARIAKNGQLIDDGGFSLNFYNSGFKQEPAISFDGTNYFVVWSDQSGYPYKIFGTRVTQDGEVLDEYGIKINNKTYHTSQVNPAIAFDGINYMVVWGENDSIYGTRVSKDGTILDPDNNAIEIDSYSDTKPSIVFDGNNYLVVYLSIKYGIIVWGRQITTTGKPVNTDFLITESGAQAAVASDGTGTSLLAYTNPYIYEDSELLHNISARFIFSELNNGDTCSVKQGCSSGHCVNNVCCEAASCDDNNPCTIDSCATSGDGTCTHIPAMLGADCSDGNHCNGLEVCNNNGVCLQGEPIDCDDKNECTTDSCTPSTGACSNLSKPDTTPCNDGTACTMNDMCNNGSCTGTLYTCTTPGTCEKTEGAACNGDGTCTYAAAEIGTACGDTADTTCDKPDTCGLNKVCLTNYVADTTPCNDSTACTMNDVCTSGNCSGTLYTCTTPGICEKTEGAACNGDGTCTYAAAEIGTACGDTTDTTCNKADTCGLNKVCLTNYASDSTVCRSAKGLCDIAETCDGNGSCPATDVKSTGVCRQSTGTCDVAEVCNGTDDACPAENYSTVNGTSCDDSNYETANDTCNNGTCAGTQKPGSCTTGITIGTLPYTDSGTTANRDSHISTYGSNCGSETGQNPDMLYVLSATAGKTYIITTETSNARIIETCENGKDCLGTGSSIEFTAPETKNYLIVVEATTQNGGAYTLTVTEKEIIVPDEDTIETDTSNTNTDSLPSDTDSLPSDTDSLPSDTDSLPSDTDSLLTDETTIDDIAPDDASTDSAITDEEEADESPLPDATKKDADTTKPDSIKSDTTTQDDTYPDTLVYDANTDIDAIMSNDSLLTDTDALLTKKASGCSCSLLF